MPNEPKSIPIAAPQVPGRVVDGFKAAIADPKKKPNAFIRLTASGGVHGESYDFEFRIDAAGRVETHLIDELKQRRYASPSHAVKIAAPSRFVEIARALDIDVLAKAQNPSAGFPPDSVIGRLEINDGEQSMSLVFLADDQQASHARYLAPSPLRKAVDLLYREAAIHLGTDDLKP